MASVSHPLFSHGDTGAHSINPARTTAQNTKSSNVPWSHCRLAAYSHGSYACYSLADRRAFRIKAYVRSSSDAALLTLEYATLFNVGAASPG